MSKHIFLRLLLVEVCAVTIHLLMIYFLAANLFMENQSLAGRKYGIFLFILPWLPSIIIIPHEIYYNSCLVKCYNRWVSALIGVLVFPILPIMIFLKMVNTKEDLDYVHRFIRLHDIRNIIVMNINLIVNLLLVVQDASNYSTDACLSDDLGRLACVSSPLILNSMLSVFLLLFSGISNYLYIKPTGLIHENIVQTLQFFPFLISDVMFKVGTYAYIFAYIDYWASIPMICLLFSNIITYGYFHSIEIPDAKDDADGRDAGGDAAYVLIWTGNQWMHSKSSKDSSEKTEIKSYQKLSPKLKGVISLFLHFPIDKPIISVKWSIFCSYLSCAILSAAVIVIYILVNYITSYNYFQNKLNNDKFNRVTLLLLTFSACHPLFLILTKRNFYCILKICFGFILFVFLISMTISINFMVYFNEVNSKIFIYTLSSTSNVTSINTAEIQYNAIDLQDRYNTGQIYWDLSCQNKVSANKSLLFINNECDIIFKNLTLPYIIVEHKDLRSSSPKYRTITYKQFKNIKEFVMLTGNLFTSTIKPSPDLLKKHVNCSNSSVVHINYSGHKKLTSKYMDNSGHITENIVIFLDSVAADVYVSCYSLLPSLKFVLKEQELTPFPLSISKKESSNVCCLNNTHSLSLFGSCKEKDLLRPSQSHSYKLGKCSRLNTQDFVSLHLMGSCLHYIFFRSLCSNFVLLENCNYSFCNFEGKF